MTDIIEFLTIVSFSRCPPIAYSGTCCKSPHETRATIPLAQMQYYDNYQYYLCEFIY